MKFDLSEIHGVIRERRTIYPEQYSERVVQKEIVQEILTNATWAPTHGKTQPWRFKVYSGAGRLKLIETIRELYTAHTPEEEFNKHKLERLQSRVEKSSVVIALSMLRTENTKIPELEEVEAVACAAQNILLTATAYGLGSYWSSPGFLYRNGAALKFGLEENHKMLGLIYLGYPSEPWPKSHRKPVEYVTEWVSE